MNILRRFLHRPGWLRLQLPAATLIALLQRTPVVRLLSLAGEAADGASSGYVLRATVATVAALGAVHTLAGATTYTLQSTASSPDTVTVNTAVNPIGFTVTNTINTGSWKIGGQLPPGMKFTALEGGNTLTGPGTLDATTAGMSDGWGGMIGGNAQTTPLLSGTPSVPGTYAINLTAYEYGALGGLQSPMYTFTVVVTAAVTAPTFTQQPASQTVTAGSPVTFTVVVSDTSATLQWMKNSSPIANATGASYTIASAQSTDAGTYTVQATNAGGMTTSQPATLVVDPQVVAPVFTIQPAAQTVVTGATVVFNAAATGATSYQWMLNGGPISGATAARLVVFNPGAGAVGTYTVVATNSAGSLTSAPAALTLSNATDIGRLINLSVNTNAGPKNVVTIGFFTGGAGTSGSQSLLLRGMGPSLAEFNVANVLADPTITVFSGTSAIASDDNWGTNQAAVSAADAATGAFSPSSPTSLDAALVAAFAAGGYTMQLSGNGTTDGQALAECYDATPAGTYTLATPRLTNLSCLTNLAAGTTLTAGFVIGGSTSRTVLVRASGPALINFGVTGTMVDPQLKLFNSADAIISANAGWGGDPQITQATQQVNAFTLTNPASTDSVVLVTLPPGAYTAQTNSVSGGGGNVLIEVYEVP
jgi:hypothetical protein